MDNLAKQQTQQQDFSTLSIIFITLISLISVFFIYCYIKYRNPLYTFKGKYELIKLGDYTSEILKFEGKKTHKQSHNNVIVMISGNPGLAQFYDKFLHALHFLLNQEIDIYCIGHINHHDFKGKPVFRLHTFQENIEHKKLFISYLLQKNPNFKFTFISHSIGSYMALKVMSTLKKSQIVKSHMLYSTLFGMLQTPSGQSFKYFIPKPMQFLMASGVHILGLLPNPVIRCLSKLNVGDNPDIIECVLRLLKFSNMGNSIRMAVHEMKEVTDLQIMEKDIKDNLDKCFYYFGLKDGWVPIHYAHALIQKFPSINHQLDQYKLEHAFVVGGSIKQAEIQAAIIQQDLPYLKDISKPATE